MLSKTLHDPSPTCTSCLPSRPSPYYSVLLSHQTLFSSFKAPCCLLHLDLHASCSSYLAPLSLPSNFTSQVLFLRYQLKSRFLRETCPHIPLEHRAHIVLDLCNCLSFLRNCKLCEGRKRIYLISFILNT